MGKNRPVSPSGEVMGVNWEIRKWVGERDSGAAKRWQQMVGTLFSDSKKESNSINYPFLYLTKKVERETTASE